MNNTFLLGPVCATLLLGLIGCGGGDGGGSGENSIVEINGDAEPTLVANLPNAVAIAAGWTHSCAVDGNGQAWCWGNNEYGQLGCLGDLPRKRDIPYTDTPCAVEPIASSMVFGSIASHRSVTCSLDLTGNAFCWGYGIPFEPLREPIGPTPVDTTEQFTILRAAMADTDMCGLTAIGERYCWGTGETTAERLVAEFKDDNGLQFVDIALSQRWGCGVTGDIEAWCWGSNWFGQLGGGTVGQFEGPLESQLPVKVVGDRSYRTIAAGLMQTCALDTEDAAWCWGLTADGQAYGAPQSVPGENRFDKIFTGGQFACGLTNNGQAWCWGNNEYGQLGNASYQDSAVPIPVVGGLYFSSLALGGYHACGITTDQQLYCWGGNDLGQLGHPR